MRLLLDSHIVVWAILQPERMTSALERTLADQRNERYVSAATIWELGLKQGREKMRATTRDLTTDLEEINAEALDVTFGHAVAAAKLPIPPLRSVRPNVHRTGPDRATDPRDCGPPSGRLRRGPPHAVNREADFVGLDLAEAFRGNSSTASHRLGTL